MHTQRGGGSSTGRGNESQPKQYRLLVNKRDKAKQKLLSKARNKFIRGMMMDTISIPEATKASQQGSVLGDPDDRVPSGAQYKYRNSIDEGTRNGQNNLAMMVEESRNYAVAQTVIFFIILLLAVFDLITDYNVYERLLEVEAELRGVNDTALAAVDKAGLLAEYKLRENEQNFNADRVCNIPYFNEGGAEKLIQTYSNLRSASLTIFWVCLLPVAMNIMYKFVVVVDNWNPNAMGSGVNRSDAEPLHPVVNPGLPFRGLMKNGNTKEKQQFRKKRMQLRSETWFYFFAQLAEDIPQAMVILLFLVLQQTSKGLACLQCYLKEEVCETKTLFENADPIVIGSLVVIIISLMFNGVHLAQRWAHYDARRREARQQDPNPTKTFIVAILAVLVYFASIVTPVIALIFVYIGPEYYVSLDLGLLQGFLVVGGIFWALGCGTCLCICGVEAGESIFTTCALCEVCEEVCELCELCEGCGGCCCCC